MRKLFKLIIMLVSLLGLIVAIFYTEPEVTKGETSSDSKQDIPVFHLYVPSSFQGTFQNIIFTDVFNDLKDKYGSDQEKFTVRIHSQDGWDMSELLDLMTKKEASIFIGPITYTRGIQKQIDEAGFRHKKLSSTSLGILVWNPVMEKHRFFEEFTRILEDDTVLKKYNITDPQDAANSKEQKFIIVIPPVMEKLVREIVSDTMKTLIDSKAVNQNEFTVQIECEVNSPEDVGKKLIDGKNLICINPCIQFGRYPHKKFGVVSLGVISSKELTGLTDLPSATFIDILHGKIGAWSQISKELNGKITVYTTEAIQFQPFFDEEIRKNIKIIGEKDSLEKIINQVAADKNSLGFIPLIDMGHMNLSRVNLLSIDKISPTNEESIEKYPYPAFYYFMYHQDISTHPFIKEFTNKLTDEIILKKYNMSNYLLIGHHNPSIVPLNEIISGIFKDLMDKDKKYVKRFRFIVISPEQLQSFDDLDLFIGGAVKSSYDSLEKRGFSIQKIGRTALVVITSKSTTKPIDFSSAVLKDVLSGKIDDWSRISPDLDGKITVYTVSEHFINDVLKIDKIKVIKKFPTEVMDAVAKNKNILGVISAEGMAEAEKRNLYFVSINKVLPADHQKYPYIYPLYFSYDKTLEQDEALAQFLKEIKKTLADEATLKKLNIWN